MILDTTLLNTTIPLDTAETVALSISYSMVYVHQVPVLDTRSAGHYLPRTRQHTAVPVLPLRCSTLRRLLLCRVGVFHSLRDRPSPLHLPPLLAQIDSPSHFLHNAVMGIFPGNCPPPTSCRHPQFPASDWFPPNKHPVPSPPRSLHRSHLKCFQMRWITSAWSSFQPTTKIGRPRAERSPSTLWLWTR